jgi:hypothetical protein
MSTVGILATIAMIQCIIWIFMISLIITLRREFKMMEGDYVSLRESHATLRELNKKMYNDRLKQIENYNNLATCYSDLILKYDKLKRSIIPTPKDKIKRLKRRVLLSKIKSKQG